MYKLTAILTMPLIHLAGIAGAHAATVVYEPFDVTDVGDSLNGKATGSGLAGNWNGYDGAGRLEIRSGDLSYGSLATKGNHVGLSTSENGRTGYSANPYAALDGAGLMDDGAELWFSFLVEQSTEDSNNRFMFSLGTDGTNSGSGSMNSSGNGLGVHIGNSRGNQISATTYTSGSQAKGAETSIAYSTVHLIVGRITWGLDGASDDTLDLFMPGTDLVLGSSISSISGVYDQSTFDTLAFSGKQDAPIIDEIRLGASYSDVVVTVPEPSATALLGLGGLALILRRRI
ncbi:PEP-CTERM sorting domain-containing protein [Verrucomicrobiaceae bacterium 5K15]|uniref:PEP-CTERM sorting domain-containing protein n=1 Tax=Oceaniferula flava TaxID=2800421 RepID=A0AAE2SBE4_9BACT|nr:PEP-CTERM sorting domain-containing protein [Oceaniferula flavus]MBK1855050.1 PEP-CTERM sorting domain-containing protein [Oceaniferula flavus]MBM1136356.1 PEP-CTERM sorting domain-containing protein [Oceaniferula flavus]